MEIPKRLLLVTWGSLGDLHPFMALGLGLRARGHAVTIAAPSVYRAKVESEGFRHLPLSPDIDFTADKALLDRLLSSRESGFALLNDILVPALPAGFDELRRYVPEFDAMISHSVVMVAPMVAEVTCIPWISVLLSPYLVMSPHDLPRSPQFAPLMPIGWLGPRVSAGVFRTLMPLMGYFFRSVQDFRVSVGLARTNSPLFTDARSPLLTLVPISQPFLEPQPDWAESMRQTGFLFYDRAENPSFEGKDELREFLSEGPVLAFTAGSSAVFGAQRFLSESLECAERLGVRSVILTGKDWRPERVPESVLTLPYAPYSELFPSCSVIVHSGGIGTTAQVLRAGRPSLVVPFANDQFDNAHRVRRLGVGLSLPAERYTAKRAARMIRRILSGSTMDTSAQRIAGEIRQEDAVDEACKRIAAVLLT